MQIFNVDFDPIWPVGCCLVIAANDIDEARKIAKETLMKDSIMKFHLAEVDTSGPCVIQYLSGDY